LLGEQRRFFVSFVHPVKKEALMIKNVILWLIKIAKDGFSFWFRKEEPEEKEFINGIVYDDGEGLTDPLEFIAKP